MIDTVFKILNNLGVPVKWNKLPDVKKDATVVSYHFFEERPSLHGGGEIQELGGALQVDIYSKTNYTSVVNKAKTLLKEAGFLFCEGRDDIETIDNNMVLYHKILIFNYVESEE